MKAFFVPFSPNICSHLWSELFRATEKMRNRPCLSQLTINQLHVWMRGLGVLRSFDTRGTKRGAWTVESTGADRRAVASCKQTFIKVRRIRDLKKKIISKTVARHNSEYVTFRKEVSAQAYPREYTSCTLHIRAQGVGGGHNTRIETAVIFFFCSGSLFFFFWRKFVKSRWFFCALCAMQLRACANKMLLGDPRQADQRTQSFHFPIVIHQSLDPAARALKRQAPCLYMPSSTRQA